MMNKTNVRNMTITGLLTAISILIPMLPLRVILPPAFTATLAVHVPVMVSMFVSPFSAAFVAIGSAIGFGFTGLPPTVTARAATHIVFAVVGALMIRKQFSGILGNKIVKVVVVGIVTMILHAGFEALVTIPAMRLFTGYDGAAIYAAATTVGIGTLMHHAVDYMITIVIISALADAKLIDWTWKR